LNAHSIIRTTLSALQRAVAPFRGASDEPIASDEPVASALLAFSPSPSLQGRARWRPVMLSRATPVRPRARLDAREEANGWLFGVLFDHMIEANQAWAGPIHFANRLGHLDVVRIARMSAEEIGAILRGRDGQPALHRLWPRLARSLKGTSAILARRYDANAENVWPDGLQVGELKTRLLEFPGLGQKLSNMATALLIDHFGRRFRGLHRADIAVDRHVARVFLRTGLVAGTQGQTRYHVGEIREAVMRSARRLLPKYPAALDYPAFEVGRRFCQADRPDCGPCPLRTVCPRERRHWKLV
jgi:endonuclease III